jgi:hypothetical protein
VNGGVVGRDGDGLRTVRRRRHDDRVRAHSGLAQRCAPAASMSGRLPLHPSNGVGGRVMATGEGIDRTWIGRAVVAHTGGPRRWCGVHRVEGSPWNWGSRRSVNARVDDWILLHRRRHLPLAVGFEMGLEPQELRPGGPDAPWRPGRARLLEAPWRWSWPRRRCRASGAPLGSSSSPTGGSPGPTEGLGA